MKLINVSLIVMGAGLFLILVGWIWPVATPNSLYWSEEDAKEFGDAAAKAHALGHARAHGSSGHGNGDHAAPDPAAEKKFQEALAKSKQMLAARDSAIAARDGWASFFRWTGTIVAFLGIGGYVFCRVTAT